jgi:hypothetical protein
MGRGWNNMGGFAGQTATTREEADAAQAAGATNAQNALTRHWQTQMYSSLFADLLKLAAQHPELQKVLPCPEDKSVFVATLSALPLREQKELARAGLRLALLHFEPLHLPPEVRRISRELGFPD